MNPEPISYYSTNRRLSASPASPVSLREALFLGQAPDGGLFVPGRVPVLGTAELCALKGRTYPEIAFDVLWPFVDGTLGREAFRAMLADAYDFEVPVERIDEGVFLLRLDRGPTASFKDFAARLMARLMQALRSPGQRMTVLVATSGDTGGAVGHAFQGLEGVRVYVLYPAEEVSPAQKRQLDGLGGNVRAVRVRGTFDDCQRLVKESFLDPDLVPLQLSSANSINIGRILPQSVYYFHAWSRVAAELEPVTFSVPSGNFGNSFGCELARRMGLPVQRLILAVNANDEFPRFLESGSYRPVTPSRACLSNAMNVGHPSNLARYFEFFGGTVTKDGVVEVRPDLERMRADLCSVSVSDAATVECLKRWWNERRILLEPHGAVGVAGLERVGKGGPGPAVCLETAHPAKFDEIIRAELGFAPDRPPALRDLEARPPVFDVLERPDYRAWKDYLLSHEIH